MYCRNCGRDIGEYPYCPTCGTAAREENAAHAARPGAEEKTEKTEKTFTARVKDTFDSMTGNDGEQVDFRLRDLWCDVMKKHTREESEQLLISGTGTTTPPPEEVAIGWSRPWLYSRIFAVLAVTFALLYACVYFFNNALALPGLIFIGALMMPFSLLILFWETNIPRNISIFELVKLFFVGGVASLVFTLTIFSFISPAELDVIGAILVGIVEEVGKLIAVAIFIHRAKCRYILNGILIGAAIGTGFAVFESAGYALVYSADINGIIESIFLRGFLSAGGHVVWAAMSGAAIMFAKGEGELTMQAFGKKEFWRLFPVPIVLHAVWDMPFSTIPVLVLLIVIAWVFILALIRSGMSEINRLHEAQQAE